MKKMHPARLSIRAKMNGVLSLVFLVVILVTVYYTGHSEKSRMLELIEQQTIDITDNYFDSLNAMMLTGTIANRAIIREKLLSRPEILEVRVIRGRELNEQYGAGDNEAAEDELDARALTGEQVIQIDKSKAGRVLTVVNPVIAGENVRGVNCLGCHQVPDKTVLGAIRVQYSLAHLDKAIERSQWVGAGIISVILVAGLLVTGWLLNQIVIKKIMRLKGIMEATAQNADLSQRCELCGDDEIGAVAYAFDDMLGKFRSSIHDVAQATRELAHLSEEMSVVTEHTSQGVQKQQIETDQMGVAINEMSATAQEMAGNAGNAASTADEAVVHVDNGKLVMTQAMASMDSLVSEVAASGEAIQRLEKESDNIGNVVNVIKGIADQTNLLALNAAIEAARAGEQGRGFAVVADEVRTLANRTQEATNEIHDMIDRLQSGAHESVAVMERGKSQARVSEEQIESAVESLAEISASVDIIKSMNAQIAVAAREQSMLADELNNNVSSISEVAQQNFQGADKTSSASMALSDLAGRLQELVGKFKL